MTEHHEKSAGRNEEARSAAEAVLKEQGWKPITPDHYWAGELAVGRDGEYEASLWRGLDGEHSHPGAPWLCDVGSVPDGEKWSLWVLGVPRPEEVPALLDRYADILSVGCEGRILDLASEKVLDLEETRRRLGIPTWAESEQKAEEERERKLAPIRKTLKAAWQMLAERRWETYELIYAVGHVADDMRRPVEIMVRPFCTKDDGTLLLDLTAYYVDKRRGGGDADVWFLDHHRLVSTGIPAEYFARAHMVLHLPGGVENIPTPHEAKHLFLGA